MMHIQTTILETQRLVLRRLLPDDLDALFALYRDPEIRQYFPEGTLSYDDTQEELEWFLNGHPRHPELGLWATIHKTTGEFIGRCGLLPWTIAGREEVEVAYLLDRKYWRQGLGSEAAAAIAQYGFEQLNLSRLICLIDRDNQASQKVAMAIGMTFEKEGEDEHGPFLLYSMSRPMNPSTSALDRTVDTVVAEIRRRVARHGVPFLIALDGGSGSGKSTLALKIADRLNAVMVQSDDFFAAEITDVEWDARSAEARARDGIDWRRLQSEVLEPLLAGQPARWHAFDFVAGQRPDGTYPMSADFTERAPADIIVLDGAYSTRPELADLIDLSILVDVPIEERHKRLASREDAGFLEAWHARWDGAEQHYFTHVRPASAFDLVVGN